MQKIARLFYEENMSSKEIAEACSCSISDVYDEIRWVRLGNGVDSLNKNFLIGDDMALLAKSGIPMKEIAKITGYSYPKVRTMIENSVGELEYLLLKQLKHFHFDSGKMITCDDAERIWELYMGYKNGKWDEKNIHSINEIAKMYGTSAYTIDQIINLVSKKNIEEKKMKEKNRIEAEKKAEKEKQKEMIR